MQIRLHSHHDANEMDFDLEDLVNVEQQFYDEGFRDGFAHGRIHGLIEGRALGKEKGFEMWEEVGFYEGFARMWQVALAQQGSTDERTAGHIRHLLDLIAQFPRVNPSAGGPSELDIPKLFRQIRSRYKLLCSALGVRPTLRASDTQAEGEDPGDTPSGPQPRKERRNVWTIDNRAGNDLSF